MQEGSKLETSIGTCTIAMQYMNQKAKATQNSPRACQNNAKTCMEYSQNIKQVRLVSMDYTTSV